MIGRGTRLRPDLFGPGQNKKLFRIFDYCQNLEYFNMNPDANEGALGESLGRRLFRSRVDLITELDRTEQGGAPLRTETAELLRGEVAAMNVDNFIVRPQRQLVERYADAGSWVQLTTEAVSELLGGVAGLPSTLTDEDQDAKQFDLLILRLQLTCCAWRAWIRDTERPNNGYRVVAGGEGSNPHGCGAACLVAGDPDRCLLGGRNRFLHWRTSAARCARW